MRDVTLAVLAEKLRKACQARKEAYAEYQTAEALLNELSLKLDRAKQAESDCINSLHEAARRG
jgi:hypothetical protein